MLHSELAFLVHVYGNFHLQVVLLLEETQNCPYRMIISNTSRYSISDYICASESSGPFGPKSVSIPSLKPVRFD